MGKIQFKCPSCGASLIADDGDSIIKCKYCGNEYIEQVYRDDIVNSKYKDLVEEVARLRNNCDFDEAEEFLNQLIIEDNKNPEVFFQKILLDYGITYVDENSNIRQVPVFNFIKKDSIYKNIYYEKLIESLGNNEVKLASYKSKIDELEKLRQKVFETYSKGEPYQIFISFKKTDIENPTLRTRDLEVARRLYTKLTNDYHLKVFFSEESLKDVAGKEYEPHIFSALYSSQIFLMICASPEKPEYLLTPWIKSEWQRFLKRVDSELDENLVLIPVLCNGYSESLLPKKLQHFEGYELNEQFFENMEKTFLRVFSGSKKSKIKQLNIDSKVSKLKTSKESIVLKGFSDHKELVLSDFEKTNFDVAIANMKAQTKKDFIRAYEKLERVTETNKYNFEANLAKLKCDFQITFDTSLTEATLNGIKLAKFPQISKDLLDTLSVASDEDREKIISAFTKILEDYFGDDTIDFIKMLDSDEDLLITLLSVVDKGRMLEIIQRLEIVYRDFFDFYSNSSNSYIKRDWKRYRREFIDLLERLFRKYYSNFDEEGAKLIIDLYLFIAQKAFLAKDYGSVDKLLNQVLEIDECNIAAIWIKYINATTRTPSIYGEEAIDALVKYINEENFVPFPITDKLPGLENNKTNLYYYIVRMISSGGRMNLANEKSPFYTIFQAAMRMFKQKKKVPVAKEIIKAFTQMAESAKASKKEIIYILMRSANRLLLQKEFEEASIYFKEVLSHDADNDDAIWGLLKCESKCSTNYSLLFYKEDLSELSTFRTAVSYFKKNHPDVSPGPYLDFYSLIHKIKADKKRKAYKKAFKYFNKQLLEDEDPTDIPLITLNNQIQNEKIIEEMNDEKAANKDFKKKKSKLRKITHSFGSRTFGNIMTIVALVIILCGVYASIILLHPFIAFGVILIAWVLSSVFINTKEWDYRNGFAHNLWKTAAILGYLASIGVGRFWFLFNSTISGNEQIFLLVKDSGRDDMIILHSIILTMLAISTTFMYFSTYARSFGKTISFYQTRNNFFLILTLSFGVYALYILLGGLLPILFLIGAGIVYFGICYGCGDLN